MKTTKNSFFNVCNIYILLWLLGQIQNLFLNNSTYSILIYIPYLGMTLYYIAKAILIFRPQKVMMAFSVFFSMLLIYGIFSLFSNYDTGSDKKAFLMMLFASLGPIFPFYVFTKNGLLTEKRLLNWLVLFVVFASLDFYITKQKGLLLLAERNVQYEDVVNNSSYNVLALMPFVFLLRKKPILQYVLIGYIMFFVITGLKRGAVFTAIPLVLWFLYITRSASKNRTIVLSIMTIVLLVIGWRFTLQFYESSDYFQMRVENTMQGQSSNRGWIYGTLWEHYKTNNSLFQLFFGEGAYYTQAMTGLLAHNDWLELLIDCGLFGVVIYFVYWISFIRCWIISKSNYLLYAIIGSCFLFTFTRTFFSMSFSFLPFYICVMMGYCFAHVDTKEISNVI